MGKIADAIEEVEDELARLKDDYEALQKSYDEVIDVNEELNDRVSELALIVEKFNEMEDYIEEYHPGLITAFEVSQRLE